jgi:hypothetical protein
VFSVVPLSKLLLERGLWLPSPIFLICIHSRYAICYFIKYMLYKLSLVKWRKKYDGLNLPFSLVYDFTTKLQICYIPACFSNMPLHRFHISMYSYSSDQNISCGLYTVIFQRCQAVLFHGSSVVHTLHVTICDVNTFVWK